MALDYDDIVDLQYNAQTRAYSPIGVGYGGNPTEDRVIPSVSPYMVKLYHSPVEQVPSTFKVEIGLATLIEVPITQLPAAGQYSVEYDALGNGQVFFNAAQKGLTAKISYYHIGTIIQKETLDSRAPKDGSSNQTGTLIISHAFAQGIVTYLIKKPCMVWLDFVTGGGFGNQIFYIIQNSTDHNIYEDANGNFWNVLLMPGYYKIDPQGAAGTFKVYCTGVFGNDSIIASEIVEIV